MLTKSILVATFFALAQLTIATPPGCFLGAVNTYKDPSDIKAVCKEKDVSNTVAKFCGNDTKAALSALADICNGQGVKVATDIPTTASGSIKPSGTGNAQMTGASTIAVATSSPRASGSGAAAGATGTGTAGAAQSTGAAGKIEIGAAALVAGLMAVAL